MKTTLRNLISEIDFNNEILHSQVDWEELSSVFNIYNLSWSDDTRLKAYYIKTWYCTDSWVGIRAYFLDDEFVAISYQSGRKSNEDFGFVSNELALKTKVYLQSLVEEDEFKIDILECLDAEIPNTYKIEYNSQILHKSALLQGEKVEIVKTNYESEGIHSPNYFHTVEVKLPNGDKKEVSCKELDFKFNTLD